MEMEMKIREMTRTNQEEINAKQTSNGYDSIKRQKG